MERTTPKDATRLCATDLQDVSVLVNIDGDRRASAKALGLRRQRTSVASKSYARLTASFL